MHPNGETQPVVFVGGAPRSGTTITHKLICTSTKTNRYHPEISFILPLIHSYLAGKNNWDNHTSAFFGKPEHFLRHSRKHLEFSLAHVSRVLKNPEILSVKNPLMTQFFPTLNTLLGKRAKFVTTVRHPYSVVRSLQAVHGNLGKEFGVADAKESAQLYMNTYRHIDNPALADSLYVFRYDDILDEKVLDELRAFTGLTDIDPDQVGNSKPKTDIKPSKENPWYSPKYQAKIDTSNRLGTLEPEYSAVVKEICRPMMERFDFKDEG